MGHPVNEGLTTLKQFLESKAKARQGGSILGEKTTQPPTTPGAVPTHKDLEGVDDTGSEKLKGPT